MGFHTLCLFPTSLGAFRSVVTPFPLDLPLSAHQPFGWPVPRVPPSAVGLGAALSGEVSIFSKIEALSHLVTHGSELVLVSLLRLMLMILAAPYLHTAGTQVDHSFAGELKHHTFVANLSGGQLLQSSVH